MKHLITVLLLAFVLFTGSAVSAAAKEDIDLEKTLCSMTLEEKVGQLFLGRCPETDAVGDVSRYHLGGYLLFGRDFEGQTPDSLRQTLSA